MADERPVRQSSKVKVAVFLAGVGEGNVFTKLQLFESDGPVSDPASAVGPVISVVTSGFMTKSP